MEDQRSEKEPMRGSLKQRSDLPKILAEVPERPGCYLFKDAQGTEIYVGKAKILRRRVASYFHGRPHNSRTQALIDEIHEIEILALDSEVEALLLENRLIKDLQPRYNVVLKDGKDFPLLAITKEDFPRVLITRDQTLANAELLGPFIDSQGLREAWNFLQKTFRFRVCSKEIVSGDPRLQRARPCLNWHLKLCSGPCAAKITKTEYAQDMRHLRDLVLGRDRKTVIADLTKHMQEASAALEFELAARHRDRIKALQGLDQRGRLSDFRVPPAPVLDQAKALETLQKLLLLSNLPRRIEGFDIAHLMGRNVVASMVQFVDGVPNKTAYRRYRIQAMIDNPHGGDDFTSMAEVVTRRLRRLHDEKHAAPDLLMIDGGLGQVHAVQAALKEAGLAAPNMVGLAKRDEQLVLSDGTVLSPTRRNPGLKLLMYVRDEAHRFSRRYYHLLERKGLYQTAESSTVQ